jgi:hypothetical protein
MLTPKYLPPPLDNDTRSCRNNLGVHRQATDKRLPKAQEYL